MSYNPPMARRVWRPGPQAVRYAVLGLIGLIGLVGIVMLVWRVPPALYAYVPDPKDRAAAEASTRTGLIAGLAGLGALGSLAIANRTYRLTQQGQLNDRYIKAIEQFGSDKLNVRLGGIYAIERILTEFRQGSELGPLIEVLSAFVRESSRSAGSVADAADAEQRDAADDDERRDAADAERRGPAADIVAAVTVLGRTAKRPSLSRADLTSARLVGISLPSADLSGFQLHEVDLSGSRLDRANLSRAELFGADLSQALLYAANLSDTDLTRTMLMQADLAEANLSGARLDGANLSGARLDRADLSGARLAWADLSGAQLYHANLTGADLYHAHLTGARLDGTDLTEAKGLAQAQLDAAQGDAQTRLPNGLHMMSGHER
jgi:uncharacterized protein YjbI with pentapeptide repeats